MRTIKESLSMQNCPCGMNKTYSECCGVFIDGHNKPSTPEQLMRSRYTAYTKANVEYIARTMRAPANIGFDLDSSRKWAQQVKWVKLEVIKAYVTESAGFVEFIAHLKQNGKYKKLHELSEFHFVDGEWYYVDGKYDGT